MGSPSPERNQNRGEKIPFAKYSGGAVRREDARIDIAMFSRTGDSIIIVENKSNGAGDMDLQLVRYVGK